MKMSFGSLVVLGFLFAAFAGFRTAAAADDAAATGKIYELRIYTASPGKLDALNARFRDHTCKLFQKHGIEVIGFWVPTTGEEAKNTLYYIVTFPSVEAQKKAWAAFRADPAWIKAKADSEKDGSLTVEVKSKNMQPTDFSPLK